MTQYGKIPLFFEKGERLTLNARPWNRLSYLTLNEIRENMNLPRIRRNIQELEIPARQIGRTERRRQELIEHIRNGVGVRPRSEDNRYQRALREIPYRRMGYTVDSGVDSDMIDAIIEARSIGLHEK